MTEVTPELFESQAAACERDGSPLYAALLRRVARDLAAGGVTAELLQGWQGHPLLDALCMRLLGAVHMLVLDGRAPALAAHYPSTDGTPRHPEVEEAFLAALRAHPQEVREGLRRPVQTNEVRRSAALLAGFLEVAARTGLPLRILELGASAGLNQLWDRHHYALGPHRWGEPRAPLHLETNWRGPKPRLDAPLRVQARAACDLAPVDLRQPGTLRRLESFVWPDQPERARRLRLAARAALREEVLVEQEAALPWLQRRLAEDSDGAVTVVFHSVVWWYVPREEQRGIGEAMEQAGSRADTAAPLAWLRMEAASLQRCELRLRLWPDGTDHLLGTCGFHGQFVEWHGAA